MTPEDIRRFLMAVTRRSGEPTPDVVSERLTVLKRDAVAAGDSEAAKSLWCLQQALAVQEHYLLAFAKLRSGQYYDAWCELEHTELAVAALERHETGSWKDFRLDFIQAHTSKWQAIFPYKVFLSPEMIQIEKLCSVCNQPVLPRSFCGHRVGEIYDGEMCYRTVTKLELMGISMVDKPAQKYSVVFMTDEKTGKQHDHYRYDLVKYAIEALRDPFDPWSVERSSRRQPHSRFADVGRDEPCPCESGRQYNNCCLPDNGVLRPHFQFTFETAPPHKVLPTMYIE
jgi:hypothetical protein